jgi:sec-independent protein translocase protein TatA
MSPQIITPLAFPIGAPELVIILVIVLLLFGGSRLAGLGKSSGRALKEFKEETKGLRSSDKPEAAPVDPSAPEARRDV